MPPDIATVQALRSDLALQIARCLTRRELTQIEAARLFATPQPTLSKIVNGRVADLSLELLIRIAVRAGLPVVMQTGSVPEEAGAYVSGSAASAVAGPTSKLAQSARDTLIDAARRLTPEQRLNAMLEQTQLVSELHNAGRQMRGRRAARAGRTR
ncbi:MAG: XRE family transcriptional regulator [Gammaproteobacteria bacterium]